MYKTCEKNKPKTQKLLFIKRTLNTFHLNDNVDEQTIRD